jgi:hypothetical protein
MSDYRDLRNSEREFVELFKGWLEEQKDWRQSIDVEATLIRYLHARVAELPKLEEV